MQKNCSYIYLNITSELTIRTTLDSQHEYSNDQGILDCSSMEHRKDREFRIFPYQLKN